MPSHALSVLRLALHQQVTVLDWQLLPLLQARCKPADAELRYALLEHIRVAILIASEQATASLSHPMRQSLFRILNRERSVPLLADQDSAGDEIHPASTSPLRFATLLLLCPVHLQQGA